LSFQSIMGSGLKLDISRFIKNPFPVTLYLMGLESMEDFDGEVMKLHKIKYQVSSLTPIQPFSIYCRQNPYRPIKCSL